MEVISGVNNPRVKAAAELKQKKYREEKEKSGKPADYIIHDLLELKKIL